VVRSRDCKAALATLEAHFDRNDFAVERYSVADIALFG